MNDVHECDIKERLYPPVELLPDGWERVDEGYYHKVIEDHPSAPMPVCQWELTYNGYRITIESGITAESYHTVEKDPFNRFWTGVKLAHMPRVFIDSEIL